MNNFSILIDSLPIIIYTYRIDGNFEVSYVSNSLTHVTGYKLKDFIGKRSLWADNLHPDDKDEVFRTLSNLFEKGEIYHEYRWKIADGTYRWFGDASRLIKTSEGNINHIVRTFHDITEYRLMAEELHRLNAALEQR